MINVLFVCLGNICRSPTAEGVFRKLVADSELARSISIDSAGTGQWHTGREPDRRSQIAAEKRGINIKHLKARQIELKDFMNFQYIVAMDQNNMAELQSICPPEHKNRLYMMLDFASGVNVREIPDPYHSNDGFDLVIDLVENASQGLLKHIESSHFAKH